MRSGERKSADWHAEFRNWLRRGAEFQERNGKRKSKPGATKSAATIDVVWTADGPVDAQQGSEPKKRGR